jgi:hypothetical protein
MLRDARRETGLDAQPDDLVVQPRTDAAWQRDEAGPDDVVRRRQQVANVGFNTAG